MQNIIAVWHVILEDENPVDKGLSCDDDDDDDNTQRRRHSRFQPDLHASFLKIESPTQP
jgi:hypothetical protein